VIALAAASRRRGYSRDVRFRATDLSTDALTLATENAVAHGVADTIEFETADLTDLAGGITDPADFLLANLPYIPSDVIPTLPIAASFEPRGALDGGADGLAIIRRLLAQLPGALAEDGVVLLEIGADQGDALAAAAGEALPGWHVIIHADLAGRPRVAELTRGGAV
jgi:HemK-like putative methylase